jgi:hypothetical protein
MHKKSAKLEIFSQQKSIFKIRQIRDAKVENSTPAVQLITGVPYHGGTPNRTQSGGTENTKPNRVNYIFKPVLLYVYVYNFGDAVPLIYDTELLLKYGRQNTLFIHCNQPSQLNKVAEM